MKTILTPEDSSAVPHVRALGAGLFVGPYRGPSGCLTPSLAAVKGDQPGVTDVAICRVIIRFVPIEYQAAL